MLKRQVLCQIDCKTSCIVTGGDKNGNSYAIYCRVTMDYKLNAIACYGRMAKL